MKYKDWIAEDFSWSFWRFSWMKKSVRVENCYTHIYENEIKFTKIFYGLCFRTKA